MKPFKRIIALTLFLYIGHLSSFSQSDTILFQGFESGALPSNWEEDMVVGDESWKYRNGGHSPNDPGWTVPADATDITRNPPSAYDGTYNAIFFKQSLDREKTRLITPAINLEGIVKPELSFWACQIPWNFSGTTGWDRLRVYYKTSSGGVWNLLLELDDPIFEWTEVKINLPNPSSTYYIAFEGETYWGYGTCIDNVLVAERGNVDRWIGELNVSQPILNFIPTGNSNEPIIRLDIKVFGNEGEAILNSIEFTSTGTNDSDINANGVKLYATTGASFNTANPLGSPTNFNESRVALFNNLNLSLPDGQSYVWLTFDISENATHNNRVDAMIKANSILVNDTLHPATDQSPPGYRTIYKKIYFEDFEGSHGWDLTGNFIVGTPNGAGGVLGNPDPVGAYSGTKAVFHPGDYESGLSEEDAYKATSPTFNLQHYKNLIVSYKRWLNVDLFDRAYIKVSTNNGSSWSSVWNNTNYERDFQWTHAQHNIGSSFWRSPNTKLRFQMGPTYGSFYSGFTFDDVILTGEFISKDVGVVEWVSPVTGCGHTNAETVVVKVANLGGADIVDPVPVQYSFNGGITWITNTLNEQIPLGDTVTFSFTTKANLTTPGLRSDVRARTALTGDQFTSNNQITTQIYVLPTYSAPVNLSFNAENKHWRSFGHSLWQHDVASGEVITPSFSGAKSWITYSSQSYGNSYSGTSHLIFEDGFEEDLGWTLTGEFERDIPDWYSIPWGAINGEYCIGTDITGLGDSLLLYENSIIPSNQYSATSPLFDVSLYSNVTIKFYRYFVIAEGDSARVEISPDDGITWYSIWENDGQAVEDWGWDQYFYSIHDTLTFSEEFRIRFSLYYSSEDGEVAEGLYIDELYVTGDLMSPAPAYLESPCFNLSGTDEPMVELDMWIHTEEDKDGATLHYSVDNGETWAPFNSTTLYDSYWNWYTGNNVSALDADGWSGNSQGWITARQVIPEDLWNESNVKFRFVFMADGKNNDFDGIAIESFNLIELPLDLGVTEIINPATNECDRSSQEPISLKIENFGLRDMKIGDTLVVAVNVDYDGIFPGISNSAIETKILTEDFPAGATLDYTFTQHFDLSIPGEYTITAFTLVEDDPVFFSETSNDTTSIAVLVMKPYIELGPDIYTVLPDTVTLVATSVESNISYNWYDNQELIGSLSTGDTYDVPSEGGQFWVTLENLIPCMSVDNITVHKLIRDVGVTSFESPHSSCYFSEPAPFTVWITNLGSDTLKAGYTVNLSYQIEAELVVDGIDFELLTEVLPGDSISYTFDGVEFDMSAPGNFDLKAWATIEDDNDDTNDLLDENINIWDYPTFDFDPKSVTRNESQYVVDPLVVGVPSRLWEDYYWHNDGSSESTFTMTETGRVTLTVYDENMCPAEDYIDVTLLFTSIGVGDVITPLTACEYPDDVIPVFKIQNLGTNSFVGGTEITYSYSFNGSLIQTLTLTPDVDLEPDDYIETEFTIPVDISAVEEYTFTFTATFDGDFKPEDDELIHTINVYGYPLTDLGDDIFTRNPDQELDAGTDADTYLWSTEEITRTITVSESGNYSVVATNGAICSVEDDINVTFLRHDYGISELISPITDCSQIDLHDVTIRLENLGTDTISSGNQILLGYIINDYAAIEELLTFDEDFIPGDYLIFTFAEKVDMQVEGNYSVKVYCYYVDDINTLNDELDEIISIFPNPYTYLGPDTVIRTGSIILDAGEGFASYLWNDDSIEQTLLVEESGDYWVTVTNEYGCSYTSTINIISLFPDYGVTAITSPNDNCMLSSAEKVYVKVENFGSDTLYPGQVLPIRLLRNGVTQATENITFVEEFEPGDVITYIFTKTLNLSTAGSYTIEAVTLHSLDLDESNNDFSKVVEVWGIPTVTHPAFDPNTICLNAEPKELSGGIPAGGEYSGQGVLENNFYPDVAGVGIHAITYTYTEPEHGCSNFKNVSLTVLELPNVTLGLFSPICLNSLEINLTGGSPTGGEYSGTGVSEGKFYPSVAGVGIHTITYTYTDGNGCSNSATSTIEVYDQPDVTLTLISLVCLNTPPFTLTGGEPEGGVYDGTGVTSGIFYPATAGIGTHTITYTYTDVSGCSNSASDDIEVADIPNVTLDPFESVCINTTPFELSGGTPSGGIYTGESVVDNVFYPAVAGINVHTITYTYTDVSGCSNSATSEIEVNDIPMVTLSEFDPICYSANPLELSGGSPSGGVYTGTGVSGGYFTPSIAGSGVHTITYTYTDINGCSNSATTDIEVLPYTEVTLDPISSVCVDSEPFELTGGLPAGGTFGGTGVTNGIFDPAEAGVGVHTITYSITDDNDCIFTASETIEVFALPNVTFDELMPVCLDEDPFELTEGSPAGGVYSGVGVSDGFFDPSIAGVGTHTITYTYTDGNSCTNSASSDQVVNDLPVVDLGPDQTITQPLVLDAGPGYVSYLWQDGSTDQTFTVTQTGLYHVTVTDDNGCQGYDEVFITYDESPYLLISSVVTPIEECNQSDLPVEVILTNEGGGPLVSGGSFQVVYKIGTIAQATETVTVSQSFAVGEFMNYTFNQGLNIPAGDYTINFWTIFNEQPSEQTSHDATLLPIPIFSLGPDTLEVQFPYVLIAGIDNVDYLWSNGSTESSITVYQTGKYWLTVTNSYGCSSSDTIYLHDGNWVDVIPGTETLVKVYPNPVRSVLTVEVVPDKPGDYTIELFSAQGQRLLQSKNYQINSFTKEIDVFGYSPGVYLLRVLYNGKWITAKVVVER